MTSTVLSFFSPKGRIADDDDSLHGSHTEIPMRTPAQVTHALRPTTVSKEMRETVQKAREAAAEREAKIDYTLDMVAHDLVSQGHLHPAKSYLLKTPEMREHIGKMRDRLHLRNKAEESKSKVTALRKNVPKPETSKRKKEDGSHSVSTSKSNFTKEFTVNINKTGGGNTRGPKGNPGNSKNVPGNVNRKSSSMASFPSAPNKAGVKSENSKKSEQPEPWVSPRDIADEVNKHRSMPHPPPNRMPKRPVAVGTKAERNAKKASLEPIRPSNPSSSSMKNELTAQAYRVKVDISGFTNEEISLDLDGRRLLITADRPKKGTQNARKMTEIIEIPEGVNLENLKMGRRLDGSLLIEEFIPGDYLK